MTYLLDTSVIIDFLRNQKEVVDFILNHETDEMTTSAVCVFEVMSGLYRLPPEGQAKHRGDIERFFRSFSTVVPFDNEQAEEAGRIHAERAKRGHAAGDIDVLIAAAAIATGATLVTKNAKHFKPIAHLDVHIL